MIDTKHNFSGRMLLRLVVLGIFVVLLLLANLKFIDELYFSRQLTPAGLVINGSIIVIFLLGLAKVVVSLMHYMQEETALARFVRRLESGQEKPLKGISPKSIISRRYHTLVMLAGKRARINHSALAATLLASESTRISFAKYVSNILILTGVFGTIVSLSIALVGASNLLDAAQDTGNMGLVIHGMSTALSTTITAILCYLFYGYFYLKLSDAQAHLLSSVEEVTSVYLLPEFSRDSETMLEDVASLIYELREAAEGMKHVQLDYALAGTRLHEVVGSLNQRVNTTADDIGRIKQILRDGFRLPAQGD